MQPEQRLEAAISFIETSRAELADGKAVILEGFQNEVADIHHLIAKMPKEEAKQYAHFIEKLLSSLKILEQELVEQQHKVQQEIFALNRRQKALKSYQTTNYASDDNGNE